jgi:uncharacterized metal-binding protein YceD (DUF177 family)
MTPETVGPLSRLFDVRNLPAQGTEIHLVATGEECAALARDFGLPGIHSLSADFKLNSSAKGVHVAGSVRAKVTQTCVVTLDPFDSSIEEEVEVDFAKASGMPPEPPTEMHEYEPPDEIIKGVIDLGALAAEFLALGLDPYPRKPGVDFDFKDPADQEKSPFSALGSLKEKK